VLATLLVPASGGSARSAGSAGERGLAEPAAAGKVMLVVIDRIGLDDLTPSVAPNIRRLIDRGGFALMNARVRYDQYGQGSYVEVGAGGRALGGPNVGLAFNSDERLASEEGGFVEAGQLYRARTGRAAPPGSVVNLYIEEMKKQSDTPQASSLPGLLGQALRRGDKKTALVGNADSMAPASQVETGKQVELFEPRSPLVDSNSLVTMPHRESSCIAMDEQGKVPSGDVSPDVNVPSASAAGVSTDFQRLLAEARTELQTSDFLTVDTGQTTRVDEQADFYSDGALKAARRRALEECDAALGRLVGLLDLSRDTVVVCTPTPTRKMIEKGNLLTPLVVAGPGFRPGTLLGSPTTRHTGLVSNFDIAPTVLETFHLDLPAEMDGRPLTSSSRKTDLAALARFQERAAGASSARKVMVKVYAISALALIALFLVVILLREDLLTGHRWLWALVMLVVLSGPLAYLVVPVFAVPALYWMVPSAVVASILLGLAALLLKRRSAAGGGAVSSLAGEKGSTLKPLVALSGATALAILLDLVLGSPLMTGSPFGSDVIMADRYYGIGNLYTGFLLGAALLFSGLVVILFKGVLDRPAKRYAAAGAVLAVTVFFLGFGRLGAEFGGLVAALAGSLVFLMKLEGGRIGLKKVGVIVVVLVICVAVMLSADLLFPGTSSHAGKAITRMESSGPSAFISQLNRKLTANWALTWASIWRLLLLVALVAGIALNWRYRLAARIKAELPALYASLVGMAVALPVALLLNDSGIEAAAALSVFLFVPCFYLLAWVIDPRR
jgi:hypothetical protein